MKSRLETFQLVEASSSWELPSGPRHFQTTLVIVLWLEVKGLHSHHLLIPLCHPLVNHLVSYHLFSLHILLFLGTQSCHCVLTQMMADRWWHRAARSPPTLFLILESQRCQTWLVVQSLYYLTLWTAAVSLILIFLQGTKAATIISKQLNSFTYKSIGLTFAK